MAEPSYMTLYRQGLLGPRVEKALSILASCRLCPRSCGRNRLQGETGYCRTGRHAKVASYQAHFGEEAPLVGKNGSGTLFFSSCNLLCSFCQNYDISHLNQGTTVNPDQLATMMMQLSKNGCHNINFVTPTHVVPQILEALIPAIEKGLRIPLVYNSGGYENIETLALLDGIFDIYMPDFKFWSKGTAKRFCKAPDYPDCAMAALKEMHRQVGDLTVDPEGLAVRGLLVRHLVMPNRVAGTERIMGFLANEISTNAYVNLMDQYHPCGAAASDVLINRTITQEEFQAALQGAEKAGLMRLDPRQPPGKILRMLFEKC